MRAASRAVARADRRSQRLDTSRPPLVDEHVPMLGQGRGEGAATRERGDPNDQFVVQDRSRETRYLLLLTLKGGPAVYLMLASIRLLRG
jgi:hypothetical protein